MREIEQAISGAEWQAMRVIWAHPGATSQFIIQALQAGFDWQPATIKTLLGRLRKKGYLRMDKVDTKYHYWPLIAEDEQLNFQLQTVLDNSCSTKNKELITRLLEKGSYSQADLQALSQQIEAMISQAPQSVSCHCLPGQCTCGHHH